MTGFVGHSFYPDHADFSVSDCNGKLFSESGIEICSLTVYEEVAKVFFDFCYVVVTVTDAVEFEVANVL